MREELLLRHYILCIEKAYIHWAKKLIFFCNKRHPLGMGASERGFFVLAGCGRPSFGFDAWIGGAAVFAQAGDGRRFGAPWRFAKGGSDRRTVLTVPLHTRLPSSILYDCFVLPRGLLDNRRYARSARTPKPPNH